MVTTRKTNKVITSTSNNTIALSTTKPIISEYEEQNPRFRPTMEDQHEVRLNMCEGKVDGYFILDGHGGKSVAKNVKADLFNFIEKYLVDKPIPNKANLKKSIQEAVKTIDTKLLKSGRYSTIGCTMVLCLLNKVTREITCGWLGDSRAVLVMESGDAVNLSEDHKPKSPKELARIKKLPGGFVTHQRGDAARVNGNLATSRSFGDFGLKTPHLYVSNKPDFSVVKLFDAPFTLILGCDGLFDVIETKTLGKLVAAQKKIDNKKIAPVVGLAALKNGSTDNISVLAAFYDFSKK